MENKRIIRIGIIVIGLLLIPFIAMQFSTNVNWSLFDFIVAAVVLFGTGLLLDLIVSKVKKIEYRIAICIIVLAVLGLIWAELAVGIFGTPVAGN
jgi:peptidoglycan/LPS O-acetylase OafA/YrhL